MPQEMTAQQRASAILKHPAIKRGAVLEHRGVKFWILEAPRALPNGKGYTLRVDMNAGDPGDGIVTIINPRVRVPDGWDQFTGKMLTREDPVAALLEELYSAFVQKPTTASPTPFVRETRHL